METASRREATSRGQKWEVETKASNAAPELYPTLAVLREADLARARAAHRAPSYIRDGLENYWRRLLEFFPDTRTCTVEGLKAYVKHRQACSTRNQTIMKELVTLKRGFQLAEMRGPDFWPKLGSDEPSEKQGSKRHDLIVWQVWLSRLHGPAYAVALFALLTGLRWGELYRVQPEHVQEVEGGYLALRVMEKVRRKNKRQVVLGPLARLILDLGLLPFPKQDHKKARLKASKDNPTGNITLRDCRAAFATAADRAGDSRATDLAMGHSGVPARYQKADYERLAAVAVAVQEWLCATVPGTGAGYIVNPDKLDTSAST